MITWHPRFALDTAAKLAAAIFLQAMTSSAFGADIGYGPNPQLPEPTTPLIPTVKVAKAVGWKPGETPKAADGLRVVRFGDGLDHPRWLYQLPNGDVLVAESNAPPKPDDKSDGIRGWVQGLFMKRAGAKTPSPNRITLLRDADGDGVAEFKSAFIENLVSPFGMALVGTDIYVANANAIVRFPYVTGQTKITIEPEKVVDLPSGRNHHWTKSLLASADGSKLYVGVGSNSNVGENGLQEETGRGAILEIDVATRTSRIYASGLRNPVGTDWNPATNELWVAVNERDELGKDLVPDYMTSVKDGGFYGWPFSYFGQTVDPRVKPKRPDLVARAIKPDYALGAHTASLGLTFIRTQSLGAEFLGGVLVGQHGSWNRDPPAGYRVIFIAFKGGKPFGMPKPFLDGFLNDRGEARGRPVGVITESRGGILVADDVGNIIWRVSTANIK
jgi:glucose/arabinose dehydrogenase